MNEELVPGQYRLEVSSPGPERPLIKRADYERFAGGEVNYSDEFNSAGDKDEIDVTESFTKVNLRVGIRGASDNWELMLFGRNITDEEVYSISFDTPVLSGSHSAQIDEGEVYGARFQYRW